MVKFYSYRKEKLMSSISVGELRDYLNNIYEEYDDYEVIMNIKHNYDINKESGTKGWIAFINGIELDKDHKELKLMN